MFANACCHKTRHTVARLALVFGLRFAYFVVVPFIAQSAAIGQASKPEAIDSEIQAVSDGLLSVVTVAGDPHPGRNLKEEMQRRHVPAVSIAIIQHGTIRWAHAWGVVDAEGHPATPDSLFQAASISKSLSAMAALHLVEQGKLSLDAPVQTELKGWTLPQNDFTAQQPVTLRELLSHTAGLNVHGFNGYARSEPTPTLLQVLDGAKPANSEAVRVTATPGKQYSYSGGGYMIVQQMMLESTGKEFPTIMQSLVLDPVHMRHSTYQQPLPTKRLREVALPEDDKGEFIAGGPHTYPEMAAAGLWTTPSDLALWVIEMQNSLKSRANHVLSPEMTRLMVTSIKGDYGLGMGVSGKNSEPSFSHNGANAGYRAQYVGYENGDGAVIMTSGDNGGALIPQLLRSISRVYKWPTWKPTERIAMAVPEKEIERFTGTFISEMLGKLEFTINSGHLQATLGYYGTNPLFASSPSTFFSTEIEGEIQFESPDSGKLVIGKRSIPFARSR
jgi:CubicO group peptidase (beta-lactamase class C family)